MTRRIRPVAAGLLLTLTVTTLPALTACGGGKAEPDANGRLPLKVGYTSPGAGYSDLYVGVDQGIFKKHGLNVTLTRLNSSAQLVPALAGGSVQVGVGAGPDSAASIMRGSDLRYIAMSEAHFNLEAWVSPQIRTIADLKGKKVGLTSPGSEGDFGLPVLLARAGLKRGDVRQVYLRGVPAEVAALESGAVSAILTQPPQGTSTRAKGDHRLAELRSMPFPLGMYTVTASYLKDDRRVLSRFVAAEADSLRYIRTHKAATTAAIQKYTKVTSPALAGYAYGFFLKVWQKDPAVDPKLVRQGFAEAARADPKLKPPTDVSPYIATLSGGGS